MKRIVLASASPRRRELIRLITDNVLCVPSGEDETLPDGISASEVPLYLARIKAQSVAKEYPDSIVIGSDTVVILGDKILSKPESEQDAFEKLSTLSGKPHKVITACCIIDGEKIHTFSEETQVEFYELTPQEIKDYIKTGEPMDNTTVRIWNTEEMIKAGWMDSSGKWKTHNGNPPTCMDKAGAYGIQGRGSLFVKGITGDYFNVVGLPVARLKRELKEY